MIDASSLSVLGHAESETGVAKINCTETTAIIVGLNRKNYWNLLEAAIKLNAERLSKKDLIHTQNLQLRSHPQIPEIIGINTQPTAIKRPFD